MIRFAAAICVLVFALPGDGGAQDFDLSWYGEASVQIGRARDVDTQITGVAGDGETAFTTAYGFTIGGGAVIETHYDLGIELSYLRTSTDEITNSTIGTTAIESDIAALSLLATAGYRHPLESGFTPYLGGGLGVAFISVDGARASNGLFIRESDETAATATAEIGVDYAVSDAFSIGPSYRFQWFDRDDLIADLFSVRGRYAF